MEQPYMMETFLSTNRGNALVDEFCRISWKVDEELRWICWMKPAFSGVEKMLIGKKIPMNVRPLRIICLELRRELIDEKMAQKDLDHILQRLSDQSLLAEHWIKNLIYPVFLMMMMYSIFE